MRNKTLSGSFISMSAIARIDVICLCASAYKLEDNVSPENLDIITAA